MFSDDEADRWAIPPTEAFSVLGNEIRLGVLWALWEADEPKSYAELRRRVAPEDHGNFGYHLGKLRDQYIEKSPEGYLLRQPGEQVIRSVLKGSFTDDPSIEPVTVDRECAFCGSPVQVSYEDETLTVSCTGCPGLIGGSRPDGTFMNYEFPPSGLAGRSPAELVDIAHLHYDSKIIPMLNGICPECAAQVEATFEVCSDHERDAGLCSTCDRRDEAWAVLSCDHCEYERLSVVWSCAFYHPSVVTFLCDHGVDDLFSFRELLWEDPRIVGNVRTELLGRDPYRFRVVLAMDDERLAVELTDDLEIDAVDRSAR
ncbi:DUF7351 domain-containing protein [Halovivax limisalsi]|uniref:DUF7351 domain-containing protein n=1 Tax=Halovivax limisalsi TaxID=1453760 RepID=UPI001FFC7126|nr:ArsR family transcriptional regulator [Halovivax limisalsi]